MKKLIFAASLIVLGANANAQEVEGFGFNTGDVIVEGNLGWSSSNDKNIDRKENAFNINPKVGYFVNDKFAVGVDLGFGTNKTEVAGNETEKINTFDAGLFGRYYFLDLGARFKTYGEVGFGYNNVKRELLGSSEIKADGFKSNLGLGINYFLTNKMAINFALTDIISYNSVKVDGGKSVSEFNGKINVFDNFFDTATFGLTYKF